MLPAPARMGKASPLFRFAPIRAFSRMGGNPAPACREGRRFAGAARRVPRENRQAVQYRRGRLRKELSPATPAPQKGGSPFVRTGVPWACVLRVLGLPGPVPAATAFLRAGVPPCPCSTPGLAAEGLSAGPCGWTGKNSRSITLSNLSVYPAPAGAFFRGNVWIWPGPVSWWPLAGFSEVWWAEPRA